MLIQCITNACKFMASTLFENEAIRIENLKDNEFIRVKVRKANQMKQFKE